MKHQNLHTEQVRNIQQLNALAQTVGMKFRPTNVEEIMAVLGFVECCMFESLYKYYQAVNWALEEALVNETQELFD